MPAASNFFFMQINKTQFGILVLALLLLPFIAYRGWWLLGSVPATGTMCFMGKSLNGQFCSNYPVMRFTLPAGDTVFFNGLEEAQFIPGDKIPVRYLKSNPADARINQFAGIWQDMIIYALAPFVMVLLALLHPGIIEKGARISLHRSAPFITISR
jgi:hypothetical protein